MLGKQEREKLERIVSENADKRGLQKDLQEYLDKLLKQISAEEETSHEGTT